MKIVIAGAGNVGIHLAKLLAGENQDITLIDESEHKLSRLDSSFDLLTIQESPLSFHGLVVPRKHAEKHEKPVADLGVGRAVCNERCFQYSLTQCISGGVFNAAFAYMLSLWTKRNLSGLVSGSIGLFHSRESAEEFLLSPRQK